MTRCNTAVENVTLCSEFTEDDEECDAISRGITVHLINVLLRDKVDFCQVTSMIWKVRTLNIEFNGFGRKYIGIKLFCCTFVETKSSKKTASTTVVLGLSVGTVFLVIIMTAIIVRIYVR